MGALKSTAIGGATALTILYAGYIGGRYARTELNRRLTARVAHYGAGLHAEARWAHPARGGIWVVEGLHVWDDAGLLDAMARELQVEQDVVKVQELSVKVHGSAVQLREVFSLRIESESTLAQDPAAARHRELRVENLNLSWEGPDAQWALSHAALSLQRDETSTAIDLSSESADAKIRLPRDAHAPIVASGRIARFPYALVEGLVPTRSDWNLHSAVLSPEGELVLARNAGASPMAGSFTHVSWKGSLSADGLGLQNSKLSAQALEGLSFKVRSSGTWTTDQIELQAGHFELGALQADVAGMLRFGTKPELALSLTIPRVSCDALRTAVPAEMWTHLGDAKLAGSFDFTGAINTLGATEAERLHFDTHADCTFSKVPPSADPARFKSAFSYTVLDQHGAPAERTTGPGTDSWTPLDEIPDGVRAALLTSEDGGFYEHHGISLGAIRRAALKDMEARAFVQGASTLSMQLAKNVYLARNKTLGRKAEELLLTTLLEHGMSKDELLELYLNVVEFGPDTYGIRDAAMHYFGRTPRELSVAECFFLVSGLPSPKRLEAAREKGAPSSQLRAHIGFLLRTAHKRGHIEASDLARASHEALVFWRPGMPPPEPHDTWPEDPTSAGGVETGQETGAYP